MPAILIILLLLRCDMSLSTGWINREGVKHTVLSKHLISAVYVSIYSNKKATKHSLYMNWKRIVIKMTVIMKKKDTTIEEI